MTFGLVRLLENKFLGVTVLLVVGLCFNFKFYPWLGTALRTCFSAEGTFLHSHLDPEEDHNRPATTILAAVVSHISHLRFQVWFLRQE